MGKNSAEFSHKIRVLFEDGDKEGLVSLLRQPDDPGLRAEAASALGRLFDYEVTESLARSFLEDPEGAVRAAALKALGELHGTQTETVIASYRSGPKPEDDWLQAEEKGDDEEGRQDEPEPNEDISQKISYLSEKKDIQGLTAVLRQPGPPEVRSEAAAALGRTLDFQATEPLVRSHLEDPEAAVRSAARKALDELHGSRAETVIAGYRSGPASEEPWLVENTEPGSVEEFDLDEEGLDEDDLDEVDLDEITEDAGEIGSLRGDVLEGFSLEGLIQVATHEPNLEMRLKVIRLLARSRSSRATDLLAYLALRADHKALRQAAYQALEKQYGDETDKLLQGYQEDSALDEFDEDELDDDYEEDGDEEEEFEQNDAQTTRLDYPVVAGQSQHEPVTQEMGFPWQAVGIIAIVAIGFVLVYLLLSGH